MVLKVGEKYLSISILGGLNVCAFKNKEKKVNHPDYVGNGVSIWIKKKKETENTQEPDVEVELI